MDNVHSSLANKIENLKESKPCASVIPYRLSCIYENWCAYCAKIVDDSQTIYSPTNDKISVGLGIQCCKLHKSIAYIDLTNYLKQKLYVYLPKKTLLDLGLSTDQQYIIVRTSGAIENTWKLNDLWYGGCDFKKSNTLTNATWYVHMYSENFEMVYNFKDVGQTLKLNGFSQESIDALINTLDKVLAESTNYFI
jgi:hypothetical protein